MKDIQELDNCLHQTINYLIENWFKVDSGIVACALKDGNKIAFATSSRNGKNWLHAERNAYNKFKYLYGEPSKEAVFIISLSPCVEELKYRAELSCVELIKSLGIKRIHFGIIDTLHVSSISAYSKIGFVASVTNDSSLAMICNNLMELFSKYESRINSELLEIKNELGNDFFKSIIPKN